jgi:hypothetical protein
MIFTHFTRRRQWPPLVAEGSGEGRRARRLASNALLSIAAAATAALL